MLLRYFYQDKLAHASYMVGCQATGEALIIDPGRDIDLYIEAARREGMRITAVTETHIHADFLSGARQLAAETGATLYLSACGGAEWSYQFPHQPLRNGDQFTVGNLLLEAAHTPGHTPEHVSFLLTDQPVTDEPIGIFSGDFIFAGDVGRPDLLEEAVQQAGTAVAGAHAMYQSVQRFRQLPDYLQVWPGHGAGSACGKALGAIPSTTLGYEKRFNWAFQIEDRALFTERLLEGQPLAPTYFAQMKRLNIAGAAAVPQTALKEFSAAELTALIAAGHPVVDSRRQSKFAAGHLAGTINIPRGQSFTNWAGWLLPYDQPIYLIAEAAVAAELRADLAYIGLDQVVGYLVPHNLPADALVQYREASPAAVAPLIAAGEVTLIDVRNPDEWDAGHIAGASHFPLGHLHRNLGQIPTDKPVVIHCQSGFRSAIGASILQANGFTDVTNMSGGYGAWGALQLKERAPERS